MKNTALTFLLLLCSLVSCRKSGNENPDGGQGVGRCRVSGFTDYVNGSHAGTIHTLYDSDGRLKSVVYPQGGYDFVFRGDTIFVRVSGICGNRTDTIVHNGSRITMAAYGDQRAHRSISYFYDAAGQIHMSRCNVGGAIQEDYFIWSGGDMIADSIVVDGVPEVTWRYDYDLNRSDQVGNPGTIMAFLTDGLPLYKTRHLRTHVDHGYGITYKYWYEFDSDQKINRAYILGSQLPDTSMFEYTYECP